MLLTAVALLAGMTTVLAPAPPAAADADPIPGVPPVPAAGPGVEGWGIPIDSEKIPVQWTYEVYYTEPYFGNGQYVQQCGFRAFVDFDRAQYGSPNGDGTYTIMRAEKESASEWEVDANGPIKMAEQVVYVYGGTYTDGVYEPLDPEAVATMCSSAKRAEWAYQFENVNNPYGDYWAWPDTFWTLGPVNKLGGQLFVRPPSTTGHTVKEGELLPLTLQVKNQDDADMTDVHVTSVEVVSTDEDAVGAATIVPVGAALPTSIAPSSLVFTDFDVTPTHAGMVSVQVKVEATLSTDEVVSGTYLFDVTIKGAPLKVTIEQDPPDLIYSQEQDAGADDPNVFDVKVTVTNTSEEDVTNIKSIDTDSPLQINSRLPGGAGAAIELQYDGFVPSDFGDLGPGQSETLTYTYKALDRVLADVTYAVQGVQNGSAVSAHGTGEIKVGKDIWLEAEFGPGEEGRQYISGQTVRIAGTLKNVTKVLGADGSVLDKGFDVGVLVVPTFEEGVNAGGGNVFKAADAGKATPLSPEPIMIEPGDTVNVSAILATVEMTTPSKAEVTYKIKIFKHKDGEDVAEGDETNIKLKAASEEQSFPLAAVPKGKTDEWLTCPTELPWAPYLSCTTTNGLKSFATGLWNIGAVVVYGSGQAARAYYGVLSTELWGIGKLAQAALGDQAALDEITTEIKSDVDALWILWGKAKSGLPSETDVRTAVESAFTQLDTMVRTYTFKQWAGAATEFAAANIDSTVPLAKLVLQKVAVRAVAAAAGRQGAKTVVEREVLEKAARDQADTVATRVADELALPHGDITKGGVLKAGDDVTQMPKVWQKFGASARDIGNVLKIAKEEGVNILFRARAEKAIALMQDGLAVLKPSGVTIKTVSELDVKFLGYKDDWLAKAVLVEPPVTWAPAGATRNNAIETYLNTFAELQGTSGAARDLRAAVKARLEQRLDEWPVQLQKFSGYAEHGIDASFYAEKQGLKEGLITNEASLRKAEVTVESLGGAGSEPARRVFQLKMADENGVLKWITGDIDFLAILNPDGTILKDIVKRTRIYESLRSLLGMQHGESMTYAGSEKLRQEFLGCCTEGKNTMLAATHDGRVVATNFDDKLAVMPDGLNAEMLPAGTAEAIDSFVYLTGVTSEMVSAARAGAAVPLPSVVDAVGNFIGGKINPVPTDAKGVLEALTALQSTVNKTSFDRNGKPIGATKTSDFDGLVPVIYTPSGGQPLRTPGRAFTQNPAGPSYLASPTAFLRDADPAVDALAGAWADVTGDGYLLPAIGSWRELTADDLGPDTGVAPFTMLGTAADTGATTLDVLTPADLGIDADSPFLQTGDRIVIDPGTTGEELAIVRSYGNGTIVLFAPLKSPHDLAARVQFLYAGTLPSSGSSNSGTRPVPQAKPCTTAPFTDVRKSDQFCGEIAWLKAQDITQGNTDGTFTAATPVSRGAMAAFLYRLEHPGATTAPACTAAPFPDVPTTSPFCGEIAWLATTGITRGYDDGTFYPERPVTRDAMAAFLHRLEEPAATAATCTSKPFSDIPTSNGFCGDITWLSTTGVTNGYDDGTYRPGTPVSRSTMAAFLYRLEHRTT